MLYKHLSGTIENEPGNRWIACMQNGLLAKEKHEGSKRGSEQVTCADKREAALTTRP